MATYYIDPAAAVNGSGTEVSPYNVIPGSLSAGNSYLYKRGTTYTAGAGTQAINIGQSGSAGSPIVIGAYGTGDRPVINGANVARGINIGTDVHHIVIEDLRITNVAGSTSRRGITNATTASSGSVDTSITIQRVEIDNVLTDSANDCNGIQLFGANNKVLHSHIHGIATDGLWYKGTSFEAGHNTIELCSQDGRAAGDNVQCGGASDSGWIHDNVLDHSNADAKQCYIHNTASAGLVFERNTCIGYAGATFTTVMITSITNAVIRRNICTGGANVHIAANSAGARVESNLCVNPFGRAIDAGAANVVVRGNTCIGADQANVYGIRHTNAAHTDVLIYNNMLVDWARGISATTGATHSYNAFSSCATNTSGGTSAGSNVTADPLLTTDYRPKVGSPLIGAGTHVSYHRDLVGVQRANPPTIGCYEPVKLSRVGT